VRDELTSIGAMAWRFDATGRPIEPRARAEDDPVVETIGAAALRDRVEVTASITSVEACRHPIRYVDVIVEDGTGELRCRFLGRHSIGGLEKGRWLRITGRVMLHLGRVCLCNPTYELCDPPDGSGVASS